MENEKLSNYPQGYTLCFVEGCPMKDKCTHYIAGQHVRDDDYFGSAVYPSVLKLKDGCKWFKEYREIVAAWGFDTLFHDVLQRHASTLRDEIKGYLGGHSAYSRYKLGERKLTPEQQEWIISLFKKYGYSDNLKFDNYVNTVEW